MDSDGKLIIDPLEAERAVKDWNTGELIYEYDVFVGYYQVTPWNRFYSPESIASSVLCDYKEPINLQIDLFEEIEIGMNMCQVADLLGSFGDFALSSSKPDAAYFGNDGTVLYVYYDYVYDQLSANNVYLVKSVEIKGAAA